MRTRHTTLAAIALALAAGAAQAGTATFTLERGGLTNVEDAAGRTQYEGGRLLKGGVRVGDYVAQRRVTFAGTSAQNTAATTYTLFFNNPGAAPYSLTVQGAWDFSSGDFSGSVSAASSRYAFAHDAVASNGRSPSTLTVQWLGATQLVIP